MAIACFGLVTGLPLRPLFSFPSFMAFISRSTLLPAAGEYLRVALFFAVAVGMVFLLDRLMAVRTRRVALSAFKACRVGRAGMRGLGRR